MTAQPLVSVVTPVYNEEACLAECIESVLAQTYTNWTYTIIDNCSTDGTPDIARAYAAKDSRIRILRNQQLLGVIANHNVAVRQVSPESKYCKVVLGDDRIFPECLEQMVGLAEAHPSIGIVGAYALEGERVALTGLPKEESVLSGRETCRRHLLDSVHVFGSANAVLYRSDLVRSRNPFYNETNIHADTEVCFALLRTSDFGFVHRVLTFTRTRPGSLSKVSYGLRTYYGSILQLLAVYGPDYLTHEEYKVQMSRHLADYYRFIGKTTLLERDKALWEYHKAQLINAGVGFSWLRLARGILEAAGHAVVHPGYSFGRVWQRRQEEPAVERRGAGGSGQASSDEMLHLTVRRGSSAE